MTLYYPDRHRKVKLEAVKVGHVARKCIVVIQKKNTKKIRKKKKKKKKKKDYNAFLGYGHLLSLLLLLHRPLLRPLSDIPLALLPWIQLLVPRHGLIVITVFLHEFFDPLYLTVALAPLYFHPALCPFDELLDYVGVSMDICTDVLTLCSCHLDVFLIEFVEAVHAGLAVDDVDDLAGGVSLNAGFTCAESQRP